MKIKLNLIVMKKVYTLIDKEKEFFKSIRIDSLKLIHDKKINIVELANKCNLDLKELVEIYNTLVEW